MNIEERFWSQVNKTDTCWLWTGYINPGGYGIAKSMGRRVKAHRMSYELLVGEIPTGLVLDHLCRNRGCVNPTHLEAVTTKENNLRGVGAAARNSRVTHCPQGHTYDEVNTGRTQDNRRYCRQCQKDYVARNQDKTLAYHRDYWNKTKDVRNAERRKLLCKNGHPIDKEKMRVDGRIMRWCSICQKEKSNKMIKAHWGNK